MPDPHPKAVDTGTYPPNRGLATAPARTRHGDGPAALVEAHALERTYWVGGRPVVALASATCTILPGDRIAVIGPSGGGKSTLLHLLGGLDTPTGGTVRWPGLGPGADRRPARVAFVFQMPSLLAPLTVVENVELPLLLERVSASEARAAALRALARLDLLPLVDALPEEISGGQAQRVAVARALACRPRLILADEPTGQLDRATAQHLLDALLASLEGTEAALVVATHDRSVAERMRTVWRLRRGILEAWG